WYTSHGRSRALRWAHRVIAAAATASAESYPPGGAKAFVLGHGIDTVRFAPAPGRQARNDPPVIGTAGRLTPLKGFEEVIRAVALLHQQGRVRPRVRIAGGPFYAGDHAYAETLRRLAVNAGLEGQVEFLGALPAPAMPDFYRSLDVFVNWRRQPALDKTGLEALASGTALVTNNTAYASLLGSLAQDFLVAGTPEDLARGLDGVLGMHLGVRAAALQQLRRATVQRHSADGLAARLVGLFEALRTGTAPPFEHLAGRGPAA
ncbi:MAG: glycosyltransferase family 4 protein, partial [Actinobacteria bacterium]|nr:glycosyltransferase family 4 protein [Actinomycetota bacterium]